MRKFVSNENRNKITNRTFAASEIESCHWIELNVLLQNILKQNSIADIHQ